MQGRKQAEGGGRRGRPMGENFKSKKRRNRGNEKEEEEDIGERKARGQE